MVLLLPTLLLLLNPGTQSQLFAVGVDPADEYDEAKKEAEGAANDPASAQNPEPSTTP